MKKSTKSLIIASALVISGFMGIMALVPQGTPVSELSDKELSAAIKKVDAEISRSWVAFDGLLNSMPSSKRNISIKIGRLTKTMNMHNSNIQSTKTELKNNKPTLQERKNELQRLKKEEESRLQQLDKNRKKDQESQLQKLESAEDLSSKKESIVKNITTITSRIENLEREFLLALKKNNKAKARNTRDAKNALISMLELLKGQLQTAEKKQKNLDKLKKDLRMKWQKREGEIKAFYYTSIIKLRGETLNLEKQQKLLNQKLDQERKGYDKAKQEIEALKKQQDDLENKKSNLDTKLDELEKRQTELQAEQKKRSSVSFKTKKGITKLKGRFTRSK